MRYGKRHSAILRILQEEGTCSIADLARRMNVSLETIRRDVKPLTDAGEVLKVHGAVSLPYQFGEAPYERRMRENADAKRAIAMQASRHIQDGDSVMLDTGTTTSYLARELRKRRDLTVVTNSSDVARTLATVNGNTVYMAGGALRGDSGAAFGHAAMDFVSRFQVRHAIISIGALATETGAMDNNLEEAEFGRAVLARGANRMIVSDCSKFGRQGLVKVCDLSDMDVLVTDAAPSGPLAEALEAAGVRVETATVSKAVA